MNGYEIAAIVVAAVLIQLVLSTLTVAGMYAILNRLNDSDQIGIWILSFWFWPVILPGLGISHIRQHLPKSHPFTPNQIALKISGFDTNGVDGDHRYPYVKKTS